MLLSMFHITWVFVLELIKCLTKHWQILVIFHSNKIEIDVAFIFFLTFNAFDTEFNHRKSDCCVNFRSNENFNHKFLHANIRPALLVTVWTRVLFFFIFLLYFIKKVSVRAFEMLSILFVNWEKENLRAVRMTPIWYGPQWQFERKQH